MALTPDDVKRIDAALASLKGSLKDELAAARKGEAAPTGFDDAFLNTVAEKYLSTTGILRLLGDARLADAGKRASCVCGCSCAEPSKGLIWY